MRAGILNQQHVPAAALVSLDGGVMPGMAGQPIQPLVVPGESGEGATPVGGIISGVGAGAGVGGDAGAGLGVGGLMNGHMVMMPPLGLMDEDDDDSGSSSEDEGLSFYGRNRERQDQLQQQQQQYYYDPNQPQPSYYVSPQQTQPIQNVHQPQSNYYSGNEQPLRQGDFYAFFHIFSSIRFILRINF